MTEAGLVLACVGCCCGHPQNGRTMAPPRVLKREAKRVFAASGLEGWVRLSFTECLGPCSESNVVLVYLNGRTRWFGRVDSPALFSVVLKYVSLAAQTSDAPLPDELIEKSFSWAGGGIGPEPPLKGEV